MKYRNKVFIATSMDGYIADENGGIDWLHSIPNPDGIDMGYQEFMKDIDALLMGRKTFEKVCSFDIDWPYQKPVFVISESLLKLPSEYKEKAILVNGPLKQVLENIHNRGYHHLYIDGGKTIQSFLKDDRIDSMIITIIPVLLGKGIPLFGTLSNPLNFECVQSRVYLDCIVQNHFVRKR